MTGPEYETHIGPASELARLDELAHPGGSVIVAASLESWRNPSDQCVLVVIAPGGTRILMLPADQVVTYRRPLPPAETED